MIKANSSMLNATGILGLPGNGALSLSQVQVHEMEDQTFSKVTAAGSLKFPSFVFLI